MAFPRSYLGHGIGLRAPHFEAFEHGTAPGIDWVEVATESFMTAGGRHLAILEGVRARMPIALHGMSLSIGSVDPLNRTYLLELGKLIDRLQPAWISDHLGWSSYAGHYAHELWPMPYTSEALGHVVSRVRRVQDTLGRQILLENIASYVGFNASTMREWEFLANVAERADCGILLDLNSVFVTANNLGFAAETYLEALPTERVAELHLAGFRDKGAYMLDSHDAPVDAAVWDLYRQALRRFGAQPTVIEWDEAIPSLDIVARQCSEARRIESEELGHVSVALGRAVRASETPLRPPGHAPGPTESVAR